MHIGDKIHLGLHILKVLYLNVCCIGAYYLTLQA